MKGLPSLLIAGCSDQVSDMNILEQDGNDIITGYNYNLSNLIGSGKYFDYEELVKGNLQRWGSIVGISGKPFIPTITSGWDPKPIKYMSASSPAFINRSPKNLMTIVKCQRSGYKGIVKS